MRILIKLLIVLCFLSCKQNLEKLDRKDFSISYPSHLKLDESGQEGTVFILTTQKESPTDVFIENINLVTKDIGNIKFDEFVKQTEKEIKNFANIIESKKLKINNTDCIRLVIETNQNNIKFTYIQHILIGNNKAYVLTFSCEDRVFDKYFEEMNNVMMSFKLK